VYPRWPHLALGILIVARSLTARAADSSNVLPEGKYRDLVVRTCAVCHSIDHVVSQRRSADEWDNILGTMLDRGAQATDTEQAQILEYLVSNFGKPK